VVGGYVKASLPQVCKWKPDRQLRKERCGRTVIAHAAGIGLMEHPAHRIEQFHEASPFRHFRTGCHHPITRTFPARLEARSTKGAASHFVSPSHHTQQLHLPPSATAESLFCYGGLNLFTFCLSRISTVRPVQHGTGRGRPKHSPRSRLSQPSSRNPKKVHRRPASSHPRHQLPAASIEQLAGPLCLCWRWLPASVSPLITTP